MTTRHQRVALYENVGIGEIIFRLGELNCFFRRDGIDIHIKNVLSQRDLEGRGRERRYYLDQVINIGDRVLIIDYKTSLLQPLKEKGQKKYTGLNLQHAVEVENSLRELSRIGHGNINFYAVFFGLIHSLLDDDIARNKINNIYREFRGLTNENMRKLFLYRLTPATTSYISLKELMNRLVVSPNSVINIKVSLPPDSELHTAVYGTRWVDREELRTLTVLPCTIPCNFLPDTSYLFQRLLNKIRDYRNHNIGGILERINGIVEGTATTAEIIGGGIMNFYLLLYALVDIVLEGHPNEENIRDELFGCLASRLNGTNSSLFGLYRVASEVYRCINCLRCDDVGICILAHELCPPCIPNRTEVCESLCPHFIHLLLSFPSLGFLPPRKLYVCLACGNDPPITANSMIGLIFNMITSEVIEQALEKEKNTKIKADIYGIKVTDKNKEKIEDLLFNKFKEYMRDKWLLVLKSDGTIRLERIGPDCCSEDEDEEKEEESEL